MRQSRPSQCLAMVVWADPIFAQLLLLLSFLAYPPDPTRRRAELWHLNPSGPSEETPIPMLELPLGATCELTTPSAGSDPMRPHTSHKERITRSIVCDVARRQGYRRFLGWVASFLPRICDQGGNGIWGAGCAGLSVGFIGKTTRI